MDSQIIITINDKKIKCLPGKTVMQVARENGISIPGLCGHADFSPKANCRICVVEVDGANTLKTSCSLLVKEGMNIKTDTARVIKARNTNLELIFAEHIEKCAECIWRFECKLLEYAGKFKIRLNTFNDRKGKRTTYKFANAVEIDGTQCIDCRNCIDACSILQNIHYLKLEGKGADQEVVPVKDRQCILCGQCAVHCPVSAAQEQANWKDVENIIKENKKIVVAQFAPSIRVSIGEDFQLPYGQIMTGHVVAGLRALVFAHVFDLNFSADLTTIIEAEELLERIKNKGTMPMITSCCPGWVNYAEIYHPEILPHLTTSRSPQIHGGGLIKTYWAEKMKIDPKNIVVVSIMPCTAKKYEASRPELKVNGLNPVDYVLTTREFSFMMKKKNIDFPNLEESVADNPFGEYSGAAVIFGGSGGVMESALRTAHFMACGKRSDGICEKRIDFEEVRGLQDVKKAIVNVAGIKARVAVVNGIGNVEGVLANLKDFDYIEVMACPGGCIGGGGQPIPTNKEIRQKRMEALYKDDKDKKIRISHENKGALQALAWLEKKGDLHGQVLHTKYGKQKGF
jgi:NADH-quinone oxidoreductase subunit G/NADP-reducing hydrogenase subunit HndD